MSNPYNRFRRCRGRGFCRWKIQNRAFGDDADLGLRRTVYAPLRLQSV